MMHRFPNCYPDDNAGSLEIDRSFFSAVRFRVYRFPAFWSFEQVVWLDQVSACMMIPKQTQLNTKNNKIKCPFKAFGVFIHYLPNFDINDITLAGNRSIQLLKHASGLVTLYII